MSNWCLNILTVTGNGKQVRAFQRKVYTRHENGHFIDFNATVPMPKELRDTVSPPGSESEIARQKILAQKYGSGNWYDWAKKNWGCKWNAGQTDKKSIPNGLEFSFSTSGVPPSTWLFKTAALYPCLIFRDYWYIEGESFGKIEVWSENGEVRKKVCFLSEHTWLLAVDPIYQDRYKFISKGGYDFVIDTYCKEELDYPTLSETLLKRIKKEDLPLFINFKWYDQQEAFEARLSGKEP